MGATGSAELLAEPCPLFVLAKFLIFLDRNRKIDSGVIPYTIHDDDTLLTMEKEIAKNQGRDQYTDPRAFSFGKYFEGPLLFRAVRKNESNFGKEPKHTQFQK